MIRFAVLALFTHEMSGVAALSVPNKRTYCDQDRCAFICADNMRDARGARPGERAMESGRGDGDCFLPVKTR